MIVNEAESTVGRIAGILCSILRKYSLPCGLSLLLVSTSTLFGQSCANLSGTWQVEEDSTITYNIGGQITVVPGGGSGPMAITQTGCEIHFVSVGINPVDGSIIEFPRDGTVDGTHVSYSGPAGVIIPGATCSHNYLNGDGDLQGNTISVTHVGRVECKTMGIPIEVTISGTAVFTRDSPPTPPTAAFGFTPLQPVVGDTVSFDATGSTDSDGHIVSYAWDFETDGITDVQGPSAVRTTHSFTTRAGRFQVKLTVIDEDGLSSSLLRDVEVGLCDDRPDRPDPWEISIYPVNILTEDGPLGPPLVADNGETLQLFWRDPGPNAYYQLIFTGVGGSPSGTIGGCKWHEGVNAAWVWGPDINGNGQPDFFRRTFWENIDAGKDDDGDGLLDVWFFSYDVCANKFTRHWCKFKYRCRPPLPSDGTFEQGCKPPWEGPAMTVKYVDPPLGPETQAFFAAWFADRPGDSEPNVTMGPLHGQPADLNLDGTVNPVDYAQLMRAMGSATNTALYNPFADINMDGSVTSEDVQIVAAADLDGDGLEDWRELLAGTDPFDKMSALRITRASRNADRTVTIEWPSANTMRYTVLRFADPSLADSIVVARDLAATPPLNTFNDSTTAEATSSFYRVVGTFLANHQ